MEFEQDPPPLVSFPIAYDHSLVKQATTSKPKHTSKKAKDPKCVGVDGNGSPNQSFRKNGQPQPHHKKQIRRRLHTSRPYQERLLNMAEARREIVTALKYHRAAKKQASDEQQQLQQQNQQSQQQPHQQSLSLQHSHLSSFDQDGRSKSRRNPRIYPSCTTKFSNYMDDFSYSSSSSFSSLPTSPTPNYYSNPIPVTNSPFAYPPTNAETPNFTYPNQPIEMNLNLHYFNNLQASLILNSNNNVSSMCPYSSPTPSSPPLPVGTDQNVPSTEISQGEGVSSMVDTIESSATIQASGDLHTAMDDEGMAEIRSLGELHHMVWNDTMSLVTSAWWFNCLKNMEHDAHEVKTKDGTCHDDIFDELIDFPNWLNDANENCLEQYSEDYFQDPTLLPW
ncbi:hypothetical protein VNO78_29102 [Psophocarpus tetragonolobus]|uniref:Uncharacterized protein n=1 Tax=Psophocarpus tetragonolobus TaxID=3891 RepID=A0AAN9RUD2_PSOTE